MKLLCSSTILALSLQLNSVAAFAGTAIVVVPANANGGFGSASLPYVEMKKAIEITKAGRVKISYLSGSWCGGGTTSLCYDPNGGAWGPGLITDYSPLQQASGVSGTRINNLMALMGAFVPRSLAAINGFRPIDGTKISDGIGIMPDKLFFVGRFNIINVSGPGILYLGVNDSVVSDNVGELIIQVTAP